MKVKAITTIKCGDHFFIAGQILDDEIDEIPKHILDLIDQKSHLVAVLDEQPMIPSTPVGSVDDDNNDDELDKIIGASDEDDADEGEKDNSDGEVNGENPDTPEEEKINRRGKNRK